MNNIAEDTTMTESMERYTILQEAQPLTEQEQTLVLKALNVELEKDTSFSEYVAMVGRAIKQTIKAIWEWIRKVYRKVMDFIFGTQKQKYYENEAYNMKRDVMVEVCNTNVKTITEYAVGSNGVPSFNTTDSNALAMFFVQNHRRMLNIVIVDTLADKLFDGFNINHVKINESTMNNLYPKAVAFVLSKNGVTVIDVTGKVTTLPLASKENHALLNNKDIIGGFDNLPEENPKKLRTEVNKFLTHAESTSTNGEPTAEGLIATRLSQAMIKSIDAFNNGDTLDEIIENNASEVRELTFFYHDKNKKKARKASTNARQKIPHDPNGRIIGVIKRNGRLVFQLRDEPDTWETIIIQQDRKEYFLVLRGVNGFELKEKTDKAVPGLEFDASVKIRGERGSELRWSHNTLSIVGNNNVTT